METCPPETGAAAAKASFPFDSDFVVRRVLPACVRKDPQSHDAALKMPDVLRCHLEVMVRHGWPPVSVHAPLL